MTYRWCRYNWDKIEHHFLVNPDRDQEPLLAVVWVRDGSFCVHILIHGEKIGYGFASLDEARQYAEVQLALDGVTL